MLDYLHLNEPKLTINSMSLEQFAKYKCHYIKDSDLLAGKFPCKECFGLGHIYDKNDHCPVEGYRHATRIPCKTCNETGVTSDKKLWQRLFSKERKAEKDALTKWRKDRKLALAVLKKLSKRRFEALVYFKALLDKSLEQIHAYSEE